MSSVFAEYRHKEGGYPYRFEGTIEVPVIAGGTPTNPEVAEGWIRAKGYQGAMKDAMIASEVAKIMDERGVNEDVAVEELAKNRHLTGFRRDPEKGLYIEGRQLKACLKEAVSVAADVGKIKPRGFGANSRKGALSFVAEHVFVVERHLYLGATEPTDVVQSFVHTFRGSGIQLTETVEDARFDFTVEADYNFSDAEWAAIWTTAENQGIGAQRSQGYGRFEVVRWQNAKVTPVRRRRAA